MKRIDGFFPLQNSLNPVIRYFAHNEERAAVNERRKIQRKSKYWYDTSLQ